MKHKSIWLWSILVLLTSTLVVPAVARAAKPYNGIDPTIPVANSPLPWCSSTTELDCFESLTVTHLDGTVEKPKNFPMFTFHAGSLSGPLINLSFSSILTTPAQWDINKQYGSDFPVLEVAANHDGIAIANPDDRFTITVRTSWLKPLDVSGFARNSTVNETNIPGGHRWTLSGKPGVQETFDFHEDWYNDLGNPSAPLHAADNDTSEMYWRIDHVNPVQNGSAFSTHCSESGYTITSSNASQAGMPTLDGPDTLSYNVYAPHFKMDGKTLNLGFFQATLPLAWLDCEYPGNTLTKAAKILISVTDENGAAEVSTSSALIQNGKLEINVSGFHYSAPRIIIRRAGAKSSTITCYKGKLVKKITAVNPKCPAGYSLRK